MVPDVDGRPEEEVRCRVPGDARRATAIVAIERPAVRIAYVIRDVPHGHRQAVDEDRVARDVLEEDRVRLRDLVEVAAVRQPSLGEGAPLQAVPPDPRPRRAPLRELADPPLELRDGGHVARLHSRERLRRGEIVVVRIHEPGDHGPRPGVDLLDAGR